MKLFYNTKLIGQRDNRFSKKVYTLGSDPRINKRRVRLHKRQSFSELIRNIKRIFQYGLTITFLIFMIIGAYQSLKVQDNHISVENAVENAVAADNTISGSFESAEIPNGYIELSPKEYAKSQLPSSEWSAYEELIQNESSWIVGNINGTSGACGLGQAYPCSKFTGELGNYKDEIDWSISYIKNRYGTANEALRFWKTHKNNYGNWY